MLGLTENCWIWLAQVTREHPKMRFKLNDVHAAFPAIPRRTLTHDLGILSETGVLERTGQLKGTTYTLTPPKSRSQPRKTV